MFLLSVVFQTVFLILKRKFDEVKKVELDKNNNALKKVNVWKKCLLKHQ